ncbi:MAG: cyclic lactone autoinducer peptide [Oscillospiraceae bacterium]|nr:cyclic lactone autoinducer peptide [Oscillospiraceae bacterium]MDY3257172.1 cyclic lactone autoinducer peptide [Ruminococcus callidus]
MKKSDKVMSFVAGMIKNVSIKSAGCTSFYETYQPEEPESVRKAAEARRQAKLAKRAAKKSK